MIRKIVFLSFIAFFASMLIGGCEKETVSVVNGISPARAKEITMLAKTWFEPTPEVKDSSETITIVNDFMAKEVALNEFEYDFYMKEVSKYSFEASSESTKMSIDESYAVLKARNSLAKKIYSKPFNKLSWDEKEAVIKANNDAGNDFTHDNDSPLSESGLVTSRATATCATQSYPTRTTLATTPRLRSSGYAMAKTRGTTDCDYEFIFNPGPYNPNWAIKLYGNSLSTNLVLALGKINYRIAGSQIRVLIGANRVNFAPYDFGPNAFSRALYMEGYFI